MRKARLYIDYQKTRNQHRLRVMQGKTEAVAIYFKDRSDAERVRRMIRKTLNGLIANERIL